jgi:hypothetical protein
MSMKNSNDTFGNRTGDLPTGRFAKKKMCHRVPSVTIVITIVISIMVTSLTKFMVNVQRFLRIVIIFVRV